MVPDDTPQVLQGANIRDLTDRAIVATLMVKSFVRVRQVIKVMAHTLQVYVHALVLIAVDSMGFGLM